MTEKKTKPAADWKQIEALYRAGQLSLRQICSEVGSAVTEGAIRKRAKAHGWTRDLGQRIAREVEARVRTQAVRNDPEVRTPSTQLSTADEEQVVESNVQLGVAVKLRQISDVKRQRALLGKMLQELELETDNYPEFVELGEMLRAPDDNGQDKRNDIYNRAISLGGRVDAFKKLTEVAEKLQKMENELHGLVKDDSQATPIDEMLKRVHEKHLAAKRAA